MNNEVSVNQINYTKKIAELPQIHFKYVIYKFKKDLEAEFYNDYFLSSLGVIRVALILSIILVAAFGILDIWIVPFSKHSVWIARYAIICPSILACLLLSFASFFKRIMQLSVSIAALIGGIGIAGMVAITQESEPGFYLYYVGIILVIIAVYTLLRIRFVYASIVGLILVLSYEFVAIFFNNMLSFTERIPVFLNNNFFLVSANIMGMIAGYFIEFYIRHTFLLRKRIEYEEELKVEKTEQELVKTKHELDVVQHTVQTMELETDAGLRNISHSIMNKHAVQKAMSKKLAKRMLLLKDSIQELENKIPEAFSKSISHILDYFEKAVVSRLQKNKNNVPMETYKKFIHEIKRYITKNFEIRNIDKIKSFISKKIEYYSQEAIISLDELYNNISGIIDYIYAIISYQRGKEIAIKEHVNATLKRVYYNIMDTYEKELAAYNMAFGYEEYTKEVVVLQVYDFILEEDIIRNLFLNSFRALLESDPENVRKDKKIWIEVYLEKEKDDIEYFIIHFKDNGPGIPDDKKQDIFTGYSTKKRGIRHYEKEGLVEHGVGLGTVKKRVEEIGGTITEEGIPGQGADFIIKINKYMQKLVEIKSQDFGIPGIQTQVVDLYLKNKKALIIDDTQAIREELGIILKSAGLDIVYAANLNEARDKIYSKHENLDIIILDLDLGASKGEELLFELMGRKEGSIPVVIVSGSDRAYYEDKLKSLNATAVFQKPVNEEELIKSVHAILTAKNKKN